MWEQLRRFKKLRGPVRILYVRAVVLLPVISASLKARGLGATQRWLQRFLPESVSLADRNTKERIENVERAVGAAARHGISHPTCLERSLAIWWLLGREGILSQMRIGVRKTAEKFEAHAWVEYQGEALGEKDAPHEHYAAFDAELAKLMAEKP